MRWQLYLDQTHAMGVIALAMLVVEFGLFVGWYLIQVSQLPVIARHRSCLNAGLWTFLVGIYLAFISWLFFFWPA